MDDFRVLNICLSSCVFIWSFLVLLYVFFLHFVSVLLFALVSLLSLSSSCILFLSIFLSVYFFLYLLFYLFIYYVFVCCFLRLIKEEELPVCRHILAPSFLPLYLSFLSLIYRVLSCVLSIIYLYF